MEGKIEGGKSDLRTSKTTYAATGWP